MTARQVFGFWSLSFGIFFLALIAFRQEFHARTFPRGSSIEHRLGLRVENEFANLVKLDQWIKQTEFTEVTAGRVRSDLTKQIVFFSPEKPGRTEISIVYLHGMSASKKEIHPVVESLAGKLGANVFFSRLKGHGGDGEVMREVVAEDWIQDAREAVEVGGWLGRKVIVAGMSTGAPLAVISALATDLGRARSHVVAQVLISPNFMPAKPLASLAAGPSGLMLTKLVVGSYYSFQPDNAEHASAWTTRYPVEGIAAMMNLLSLNSSIDYHQVQTPTLCLYTYLDKVVDVELIKTRCGDFPNGKTVDLPEANRHEFAGDILAPNAVESTVNQILTFVEALM